MIIDACLFNNETEMLQFRMKLLWDVVDKFVIVETDKTFSSRAKPFNFECEKYAFEWAKEKIVYYPFKVDVFDLNLDVPPPTHYDPTHPSWAIEYRQRAAIIDACKYFSGEDILMLSDCDEIPSLEAVRFRKNNKLLYPMACDQYIVPYALDYYRDDIGWRGTIMCELGYARNLGTQRLRDTRNSFSPFAKGGWHLSYFGGADNIIHKIESFSHQEYNKADFKDKEYIKTCIETGGSIFKEKEFEPLKKTPPDFFPPYFLDNAPKKWWVHSSDKENNNDNY